MYTNRDFKVLVITPFQNQIELIFERLLQLIRSKESLNNSIKRNVKAPNYTLELYNGSMVRGFTAGTQSGGNANAVRGQKANMLIFDEADYLSSADIASALAVITNYPDATVWMSSTPTGRRERFYNTCKDPAWKEFHFPSSCNPLWSKEREEFNRREYTKLAYAHEFDAEFGDQEQGVYQSEYVDAAKTDYTYASQSPLENWDYCIGVDWNDVKVGTTIAVVGHNRSTGIFRLVYRESVIKEGWTQIAACQRVAELNRQWLPKFIYIDKGFGSTQNEILRKYGYDALSDPERGIKHPDAKLKDIVKTYDFGSKVKIKDLLTKQDIDKPSKPFLVENSVRRFENKTIQFSRHDEQLEAELRGYAIDHLTPAGSPVYVQTNEKVGDHNLDALNLALVAFTLQMSEFGKPVFQTDIAFSGNFGESSSEQAERLAAAKEVSSRNQQIENTRPQAGRADFAEKSGFVNSEKMPAANTTLESQQRLWSWPGWEHDAPKPVKRGRLFGKMRSRPPSRKNI
jgi:replicative DNA helicase